ncbi:MAG: CHASE3 domain-containing protein [Elusimicrobia bacterium]|nr:CHASE3 domain-containing protein [Elusimicrobiota bacterium]
MIGYFRRSIKAQIGASFGLAAIFLIILGALAIWSSFKLENTDKWVSHTHDAMGAVNNFNVSLEEAIDAQRYYIFTGKDEYFQRYGALVRLIPGRIDSLSLLASDNAVQRRRIAALRRAVSLRLAAADRAVALRRAKGEQAAAKLIARGEGENNMAEIRRILAAMELEERGLLLIRGRDAAEFGTMAELVALLGGFAAIAMLLAAVLVILRSFDRLREIQEERDRFFNTSADMLCILGADGRFRQLNPSWQKTLGFLPEALRGKSLLDITHPDDREAAAKAVAELARGRALDGFESRCVRKDGGVVWLRWSAAEAKQELIYAGARDVTAQKDAERMRDEVVSMVSHELRNPLTVIHSSFVLIERAAQSLPEDIRELLNMAQINTNRMLRLIEDFLNMKKMKYGQLEFDMEPAAISKLLEEAVSSHQAYAQLRGVGLSLSPPQNGIRVKVDRARIHQVLANLISNAIKHSPKGAAVEIRSESLEASVKISIRDRGPGIPENFRSRVFQKFAQAGSAAGGTGLGLSVAKSIVERLGGSIGFETSQDGTTFYFTLPTV